jgi:hypothetical protein
MIGTDVFGGHVYRSDDLAKKCVLFDLDEKVDRLFFAVAYIWTDI